MAGPTLIDQMAAVNAYADCLTQRGARRFPRWNRAAQGLRRAAAEVLAATETWTVLDETDPRNVRLQAPDGTRVLLSAHRYGNNNGRFKRLTILT